MSLDYVVVIDEWLDLRSIARTIGVDSSYSVVSEDSDRIEYASSDLAISCIVATNSNGGGYEVPSGVAIEAKTVLMFLINNDADPSVFDRVKCLVRSCVSLSSKNTGVFFEGECIAYRLEGEDLMVLWPDWSDALASSCVGGRTSPVH